jgi:DNA replication protein DnaC
MGRNLSDKRVYPVTRVALHMAGVPERYWTASLAPLAESPQRKKLISFLTKVHRFAKDGRGLYVHGPFETGKSFAAVAIGKEVIRRGGTFYFLKARDVLRVIYDMQETEDGNNLVRNVIRRVDLLILDDLGQEGFDPKKHGGAELEGVLRDRYDAKKSIIVTSNHSPKQLTERYTDAFTNILRRTVDTIMLNTDQWKGK